MFKYVIGFFLLLAFSVIAYIFIYLGGFKSVDVSIENVGPFHVVYIENKGPYHEISGALDRVAAAIKPLNEECKKSFAIFLEDPGQMEQDRLRSHVGCILKMVHNTETQIEGLDPELQWRVIDERLYAKGVFKGSPSLGALKIYPALDDHILKKAYKKDGPIMEIYNIISEKEVTTTSLMPVKK